MKPAELWKLVRAHFDPLLTSRGFERIKTSPPAWTRLHGERAQTVWFKARAVGTVAGEGAFTGALQLATEPQPGIEWKAGDFTSRRLFELFDTADLTAAQELHSAVAARRTKSGPPFIAHDIWCIVSSADDVQPWLTLLCTALTRHLDASPES